MSCNNCTSSAGTLCSLVSDNTDFLQKCSLMYLKVKFGLYWHGNHECILSPVKIQSSCLLKQGIPFMSRYSLSDINLTNTRTSRVARVAFILSFGISKSIVNSSIFVFIFWILFHITFRIFSFSSSLGSLLGASSESFCEFLRDCSDLELASCSKLYFTGACSLK
ncbi:unnamed protein product [Moneuplotes crassus]|uniref:Uncharacterized protein n=1 Tax=Euplotes crassus TaxID=5936 RepID=A0AAD1XVH4_EUPCR|nr:unnamed protein product [Moneuplotes crassus]